MGPGGMRLSCMGNPSPSLSLSLPLSVRIYMYIFVHGEPIEKRAEEKNKFLWGKSLGRR